MWLLVLFNMHTKEKGQLQRTNKKQNWEAVQRKKDTIMINAMTKAQGGKTSTKSALLRGVIIKSCLISGLKI